MNKFETGTIYMSGAAYGQDSRAFMNIESRSACFALVNDVDAGTKRCRIHTDNRGEYIVYDAVTVYRAERAL